MARSINRVAIIGTGVIGASWAALFLEKGLEVAATDVAPNAEVSLKKFIEEAWPALKRLGLSSRASQANLKFTPDLSTAIEGAEFVQENGPGRIDFKKKLYGQLDEILPADVIIASSSSGLTMSEIQSGCPSHPERCDRSPLQSTTHHPAPGDRRRSKTPRKTRSDALRNSTRGLGKAELGRRGVDP